MTLTIAEQILVAVRDLATTFAKPRPTLEDIVVHVWGLFPGTFGLKGYAETYPNSNKVVAELSGQRGLVRRGLLARTDSGRLTLTDDGARMAERVLERTGPTAPPAKRGRPTKPARAAAPPNGHSNGTVVPAPAIPVVELSPGDEKTLLALFHAGAVEKFRLGQKLEISFADACRFWGVALQRGFSRSGGKKNEDFSLQGEAVNVQLAHVAATLDRVEGLLVDDAGRVQTGRLSNGRLVPAGDVRELRHVHRWLEERFERHLGLIRARKVQA